MSKKPTPTVARVHELIRYDDGQLYWRNPTKRQNQGPLGCRAGDHGDRLQVIIDGRATYVHHVVWLMHHHAWPLAQVDHINGDQRDNRIENLRLLTNGENAQNRRCGGVTFEKRKVSRPWRARIMIGGRSISLGYFDTRSEAHAEYLRAKRVYHEPYVTGVGKVA